MIQNSAARLIRSVIQIESNCIRLYFRLPFVVNYHSVLISSRDLTGLRRSEDPMYLLWPISNMNFIVLSTFFIFGHPVFVLRHNSLVTWLNVWIFPFKIRTCIIESLKTFSMFNALILLVKESKIKVDLFISQLYFFWALFCHRDVALLLMAKRHPKNAVIVFCHYMIAFVLYHRFI